MLDDAIKAHANEVSGKTRWINRTEIIEGFARKTRVMQEKRTVKVYVDDKYVGKKTEWHDIKEVTR